MSKERDLRHRTANLEKEFTKIRRKVSNKHGSCARDEQEQHDQVSLTPTSRQFAALQFSNRDSGRINFSPLVLKNKQKYNLESAKKQVRSQLLKLSYKEKLIQIQSFLKKTRDLCKQYGYFTATFAMLTFSLNQTMKISIWIHPDHRSTKPLHPIKKKTPFECQLICVNELKNLIKKIFPTIDLGNGKTFGNTIAHIESLITQMNNRKNRAFGGLLKYEWGKNQNKNERKLINCQTQILKPIVNIGKRLKTTDQQTGQNQNNRFKLQIEERNKETMSTLIQSIRSANSIRERLKKQLSKTPNSKKKSIQNNSIQKQGRQKAKQRKNSWIEDKTKVGQKQRVEKKLAETLPHKNMQTVITNITKIKQQQLVKEQQTFKQFHFEQEDYLFIKAHHKQEQKKMTQSPPVKNNNVGNSKLGMKTSITGGGGGVKKPMSISIEMQSQINNLFGSCDQMSLNNFYNQQMQKKKAKNSILSKVAQEFQDLF